MITWITTVGWSPFAVINPVWAYCKEFKECPSKFILIFTKNERIKNNLILVKSYLKEIAWGYSNGDFQDENIIIHQIDDEDIQNYANTLKKIISAEMNTNPKKIILDMTPGRKYMSAINVYYGLQRTNIPIQVFYLHLEERRYQDVPYPLTPIIKNELVDIIDSTEIFTKNIEDLGENKDEIMIIQVDEIVKKIQDTQERKEMWILIAISKGLNSKSKISRFLYDKGDSTQSSELRNLLKKIESKNLIKSENMKNETTQYIGYKIIEKGLEILERIQLEGENERK